MLKQFYEKALPTQGVYCITSIGTDKKVTNKFAETLDGVFEQIEKFKSKQLNTFVALGTFDGYSRKADDCLFVRSFFIDLDVGTGKDYTLFALTDGVVKFDQKSKRINVDVAAAN